MGVPSYVTEELLQQDKEVIEASRMTKWNSEKQKSEPTKHGKGSTGRETTPRQFSQRVQEFPNDALCERTTAVFQLPEVWPQCQDLQVQGPDLQVLPWKTCIDPVRGQQKSHTKVRKLSEERLNVSSYFTTSGAF